MSVEIWDKLGMSEQMFWDLVSIGRGNGLTDEQITDRLIARRVAEEEYFARSEETSMIMKILKTPDAIKLKESL